MSFYVKNSETSKACTGPKMLHKKRELDMKDYIMTNSAYIYTTIQLYMFMDSLGI